MRCSVTRVRRSCTSRREESRGTHYRSDCPDERDAWRVHTLLTPRLEGGAVRAVEISSEPVRLATDPAAPTPPEAARRSGSGARR